MEHYLDVLGRKPGALAGSIPLAQWREQGRWPRSFDQLWQSLQTRHGTTEGTKEMIGLLLLGRRCGYERLRQTIESALELGCTDAAGSALSVESKYAPTNASGAAFGGCFTRTAPFASALAEAAARDEQL